MREQGRYARGSSSGLAVIPKGGVVGIPILFRGRRGRALGVIPGSALPFDVHLPILYSLRPSAVNPGDTRVPCISRREAHDPPTCWSWRGAVVRERGAGMDWCPLHGICRPPRPDPMNFTGYRVFTGFTTHQPSAENVWKAGALLKSEDAPSDDGAVLWGPLAS